MNYICFINVQKEQICVWSLCALVFLFCSIILARKWYFSVFLKGTCPFSSKHMSRVVLILCHQMALQVHFAFSLPLLLSPQGTGSEQKNQVLVLLHFREEMQLENIL